MADALTLGLAPTAARRLVLADGLGRVLADGLGLVLADGFGLADPDVLMEGAGSSLGSRNGLSASGSPLQPATTTALTSGSASAARRQPVMAGDATAPDEAATRFGHNSSDRRGGRTGILLTSARVWPDAQGNGVLMIAPLLNLIDGAWTPSAANDTIGVLDPATDEPVTVIPVGSSADVDAAVAGAGKAAAGWSRTAPAERAAALKAVAAHLREHADELAALTTHEMGKPTDDALGGVQAGIGAVEQYAELGPLHRGTSLQGSWDATDFMVSEPYGVAAVITPWNDPVAIVAQLLAAALVTGNCVVLKPSERTPGTGARIAELFSDELPPGVLQLVHGDARAGAPLAGHPDVELVLHVGSSATGRAIAAACAHTGAHAVLENGGKDPLVVDAGVDPAWAAAQAALGAFANAGQICTAVERVYVHEAVAEPFLAALVEAAGTTRIGPLVDRRLRDAVDVQVRAAVDSGARLIAGGVVPAGVGAFYPPTVLAGCTDDMAVMREETFGPVAPVRVVASYDEALAAAVRGSYGLAATVLTDSLAHAQHAWRELPVGTVKVNAVFGGAPGGAAQPRRGSGSGYGYGPELLDECTRTKVVHWQPPPS